MENPRTCADMDPEEFARNERKRSDEIALLSGMKRCLNPDCTIRWYAKDRCRCAKD
jgi:hypothetical protein